MHTSFLDLYYNDYKESKINKNNFILLYQLGNFFESFTFPDNVGCAVTVSEILNIQLHCRNNKLAFSHKNPKQAGIPLCSFNRHLDRLLSANYTVKVVEQSEDNPKKRIVKGIFNNTIRPFSRNFYNSNNTGEDTNDNINNLLTDTTTALQSIENSSDSCLYSLLLEKYTYHPENIQVELSLHFCSVNLENGCIEYGSLMEKMNEVEYPTTMDLNLNILFEKFFLQNGRPRECLLFFLDSTRTSSLKKEFTSDEMDYIYNRTIEKNFNIKILNSREDSVVSSKETMNTTFLEEIDFSLKKNVTMMNEACANILTYYPFAKINIYKIICFIEEYDPIQAQSLILNDESCISNENEYLRYNNDLISELNIFPESSTTVYNGSHEKANVIGGKLKITSMYELLSSSSSMNRMGKRLLREYLSRPLCNASKIFKRYDEISEFQELIITKKNESNILSFYSSLPDLEKMFLNLRRCNLSIQKTGYFFTVLRDIIIREKRYHHTTFATNQVINRITESYFNIDAMVSLSSSCSSPSSHAHLKEKKDLLSINIFPEKNNTFTTTSTETRKRINTDSEDKNTEDKNTTSYEEYCRFQQEYISLRNKLLQVEEKYDHQIEFIFSKNPKNILDNSYFSTTPSRFKKFFHHEREEGTRILSKKTSIIHFMIEKYDDTLFHLAVLATKIAKYQEEKFLENVKTITDTFLTEISSFIALLKKDSMIAPLAFFFYTHNYTRPDLVIGNHSRKKEPISYYTMINFRNPIMEFLYEDEEPYVPFSAESHASRDKIKNATRCHLLFGHNMSGKTSFCKSILSNLFMAQCGFWVPAERLEFSVYKCMFSKFTHSDNIFRKQSLFFKEVKEITYMINHSIPKYSLLALDEPFNGTETESHISLIVSTLKFLVKKDIQSLVTNHIHLISDILKKELKDRLKIILFRIKKNMLEEEQVYVSNSPSILYEREIIEDEISNEDKIYGIELSAEFNLPDEIVKEAYSYRPRIHLTYDDTNKKKRSTYNSKLKVEECFLCKKKGESLETHHIVQQHHFLQANGNRIHGMKKNSKQNLIILCHDCHLMIENKKTKQQN